jgi:hypothetical protein
MHRPAGLATQAIRSRPRVFSGVLFCFVLVTAQIVVARDVPVVGQPVANFYKAQGSGVKVAWSLDRTTVPEDEDIVATLIIKGATNPQQIVRPDLKKLDAFESRFVVTDARDAPPTAAAKEVRFSYRLRPRSRSVKEVPSLIFCYHDPAAAEGKQFPTTKAVFVEITVTAPRPKTPPPALPLSEPDHLFRSTTGSQVLGARPFSPGVWTWIVFALTGPLLATVWYVAWRRVFPDAARLARIRRTRAARRATDAIRRAGRAVDPPAAIGVAVLGYLRSRFPLPPGAVTPTEIGSALAELGLLAADCDAVADFFRSCDAARFAPPGDNGVSLAADSEALVNRLEAPA